MVLNALKLQSTKKLDYSQDLPALIGTDYTLGDADKALRSDPVLLTAWQGLIATMSSAELSVTGHGAKKAHVDFIKKALFEVLERRFADVISGLLRAVYLGCAAAEITCKYTGGKWYIKDIAPIHPRHFDFCRLTQRTGCFWADGLCYVDHRPVRVGAPGSGQPVVWWSTYGGGLLGQGLAGVVVPICREKQYIIEQRQMALQKSIQGTLCGLQDYQAAINEPLTTEEGAAIADSLAGCAAGVDNAIVLPPQLKQVMPIYPAADSISKTIEAENHLDLQILSAFGSQHLARGLLSGYGSQGAGDVDTMALNAMRLHYMQWIAGQVQGLIDWLIDVNFGPQDKYPELYLVSGTMQTTDALIRSMVQLSSAGAIRYSEKDEVFLRQLLRLPHKAPGGQAQKVPVIHDTLSGIDNRDRVLEGEKKEDGEY